MNRDFLKVGNHRKIANIYSHFLTAEEISKIDLEIKKHTALMYDLATSHYKFAIRLQKYHWRQRVSRFYYAAYNASKAIRFDSDGNHSTDVKDHNKVGALPDAFPNRAMYENELTNLREDRNSCDYDHLVEQTQLLKTPAFYQSTILNFLRDTHDHLSNRGNNLGEKL